MSKISNCLFMLEYLENGWKYNIKELAEKLEVSERMVRSYNLKKVRKTMKTV